MRPIYNNNDLCDKIMFIVEDVTEIEKLEADIKVQRKRNALKIEKLQSIVMNSKESLINFFYESYQILNSLDERPINKDKVLRHVHTLKGISRLHGLNFLSTKIHTIEGDIISLFEKGIHKKSFEMAYTDIKNTMHHQH